MKVSKQEVTLIDHCGNDLSVVNAARVSFHKESQMEVFYEPLDRNDALFDFGNGDMTKMSFRVSDKDAKLIKYLAEHNHKSPFNHAFMSFRVKAGVLVARQLVKHEYLPWNEVSRRYVDEEPELMAFQWRLAADNVKQGSGGEVPPALQQGADKKYFELVQHSLDVYDWMLENNICAEQARSCLLLSTQTEWIWSGTLFAFAKMCNLRLDSHTQKETQEVAKMIHDIAKELYPVSWKALVSYD